MIELATATRDELVAYAKDVKGMEFPKNIKTETLRSRLNGQPVVSVSNEALDTAVPAAKPDAIKMMDIIIQESDEDSGDVFVGVNGRSFLIQRGEKVTVPEHVVEVLCNAKKKLYRTKVDRSTGASSLESREVLAYQFSIVG